jgi:hypothetical protein
VLRQPPNSGCGELCTRFCVSNGGTSTCDDDNGGLCNPVCVAYQYATTDEEQVNCSF